MKKSTFYCLLAALCLYVSTAAQDTATVTGSIINNSTGEPIEGATIQVQHSKKMSTSNALGKFTLGAISLPNELTVSCVGFVPQQVSLGKSGYVTIRLTASNNELDEAVVLGYGKTSKRFNTGSVAKVSAAELARIPISNPLSSLAGRVTGVEISQTNGLPGATFNVLIRGKGSLYSGTAPLYVIDGVPFMPNRTGNQLYNAMSPLNAINPADVESIEVLKDADATAIYGSQGANGVILITTRRPAPGKTTVDLNYFTGFGKITRSPELLSTKAYLAMRRQAFANDALTPTVSTAPDLLLWDTTAYTNWQQEFIGGTAQTQNAQLSIAGGNAGTRFLLSGNYNAQTTVYPESKPVQRASGYFNFVHQPVNSRFGAQLSSNLADFYVNAPSAGLSSFIYLPPNAPSLHDSSGKLNWTDWVGIDNPMAQLEKAYKSHTYTLNNSVVLSYRIIPSLSLKLNGGYNQIRQDEYRSNPIRSQRPSTSNRGSADWQNSRLQSWMLEPLLVWTDHFGALRVEVTGGANWQKRGQETSGFSGTQYTDDDLLGNPLAAVEKSLIYSRSEYRYMAYFARAVFRFHNRYLLSLNGRRDGSSRFSPESRFANFGSVGAGWIFSEEPWLKNALPLLSYGKLRGSYGVTGNDQVGDYAFLDAWSTPLSGNYQEMTSLAPGNLYNPYLQWERNKKLEFAIETGFLKDRILLNVAWYRNRCDNQLLGLNLPALTGFTSISSNLDAQLENRGWEFELTTKNITGQHFSWQTSANISFPRTKLISYPDLENSSSRYTYAIGESLDVLFGYRYTGINPQTNLYQFEDVNKDGLINTSYDYQVIGAVQSDYYGGINNVLRYKGIELEILLQGVKQTGRNYLSTLASGPGTMSNQPAFILDEELQKYTSRTTGTVNTAYRNLQRSSAMLTDASYLRLKNLSLSYQIPFTGNMKTYVRHASVYVQGQNLFVITNYKGADPETQSMLSLPPIKMLVAGVKVGF